MARYQAPEDNRVMPLQPSAGPVNRFARPAAPPAVGGESKLAQLADALKGVQPSVMNYMYHEQGREDQAAYDKAKAMRTETALNYKEAVKSGKISLSENPFFVKAWKEQDGSITADKMNADLQIALAVGPLAASRDPEESFKMMDEFQRNWIEKHGLSNDPAFMDSFNRKADQYLYTAREHQSAVIGQRRVADVINNTAQEARAVLREELTKGVSPSAIGYTLSHLADRLNLTGMNYKQVNGVLLEAVEAESLDRGDTSAYDVLKHIETGGGTMADTKEAIASKKSLEEHLVAKQHQEAVWQRTEKEQAREDKMREITSRVYGVIGQHREQGITTTEDMFESDITELGQYSPGAAEQLREVVKQGLMPAPRADDIPTINQLWFEAINETLDTRDINSAFVVGKIKHESAKELASWIEATKRRNAEKDFTKLPGFRNMFSAIMRDFGADEFHLPSPDKVPAMNYAIHDAFQRSYAWFKQHEDADPGEVEQFGIQTYESVMRKKGVNPAKPNEVPDPSQTARDVEKKNTENMWRQMGGTKGGVAGDAVPFYSPDRSDLWLAELKEFAATGANSDNITPGLNTKLGKRLAAAGITDPHDVHDFITAQTGKYDNTK